MEKKRNPGFPGGRSCQQRLAGPRRTNKQYALRNLGAKSSESLGGLQKLDHFLQVLLCGLQPGDFIKVVECSLFSNRRA
jgi:hypothetical protein